MTLTNWYESGQKKSEGSCADGKKNGLWSWWYENGNKDREGTMKDEKSIGKWTYYNKDGSVKAVKDYD